MIHLNTTDLEALRDKEIVAEGKSFTFDLKTEHGKSWGVWRAKDVSIWTKLTNDPAHLYCEMRDSEDKQIPQVYCAYRGVISTLDNYEVLVCMLISRLFFIASIIDDLDMGKLKSPLEVKV